MISTTCSVSFAGSSRGGYGEQMLLKYSPHRMIEDLRVHLGQDWLKYPIGNRLRIAPPDVEMYAVTRSWRNWPVFFPVVYNKLTTSLDSDSFDMHTSI